MSQQVSTGERRPTISTGTVAPRVRPEIQALRALAISLVVVYHFWPGVVRGGYVGVDVFFVISGFLITSNLVRDIEANGRVRVLRFWAKRARRLLPAALVVLLATVIGIVVLVPRNLWQQFLGEVMASTLYIQNWLLAANSVDYLAASNTASPSEHFWTLSVEEQFYIALPLILIVIVALVRRRSRSARTQAITTTLAVLSAVSFVLGLWLTATTPEVAYFSTLSRAWEFGLGGLLGVLVLDGRSLLGPRVGSAVSWIGLGCIAYAALMFTGATPFPGTAALLPVVGAVMAIAAGSPSSTWSPTRLFAMRPVQFIGDVSYSLYLWHWPILILAGYAFASAMDWPLKLVLVVVSVSLAWLSKRFVEDPVRKRSFLVGRQPRWTFVAAAAGMTVVVAVASMGWASIQVALNDSLATVQALEKSGAKCFGAAAMLAGSSCPRTADATSIVPAPASAASDLPAIYTDECRSQPADPTVRTCVFGKHGSTVRVALIGDSHAAAWFPALKAISDQEGWELHTYFKASCAFSNAAREVAPGQDAAAASCAQWNKTLATDLSKTESFSVVFTSAFANGLQFLDGAGRPSEAAAIDGFRSAWRPLVDRDTTIVVIADTPHLGPAGLACVQSHLADPSECTLRAADALSTDTALTAAAEGQRNAIAVNMTDYFCTASVCPLVVGGVFVYRDAQHITATYSRSLAPWLLRSLTHKGLAALTSN